MGTTFNHYMSRTWVQPPSHSPRSVKLQPLLHTPAIRRLEELFESPRTRRSPRHQTALYFTASMAAQYKEAGFDAVSAWPSKYGTLQTGADNRITTTATSFRPRHQNAKEMVDRATEAINSRFSDMFKAFQFADMDRSGTLDKAEIRRALELWGLGRDLIDDATLDGLIHACDNDGDGQIDYKEFVDALARDTVTLAAMGKRDMQAKEAMGADDLDAEREFLGLRLGTFRSGKMGAARSARATTIAHKVVGETISSPRRPAPVPPPVKSPRTPVASPRVARIS